MRIATLKTAIAIFGCLAVVAPLTGCKRATTGTLYGRVTLAGKPLEKGAIVFQTAGKGGAIMAPLGRDGAYRVRTSAGDGLPPGDYLVAVHPQMSFSGEQPLAGQPTETLAGPSSIPQKHQDVATSGLKVTIRLGNNPPYDVDLSP